MKTVNDMMKEHTIVDIDDYVHVVDGKVVCYEPDTIDFKDERQVDNFFGLVTDLFVHDMFPIRHYGKENTRLVMVGKKYDRKKWVFAEHISDFPPELVEKVRVAIDEYENRSSNTI